MKYIILIFVFSLVFESCSNKTKLQDCSEIIIEPIFYSHDNDSPEDDLRRHFLLCKNYKSECFNMVDFIKLAYEYIDTAKCCLPIGKIYFCSKNSFKKYDTQPWRKIRKSYIISIGFWSKDVEMQVKNPQIRNLTFWDEGRNQHIDFLYYNKFLDSLYQYKTKKY